MLTGIAYASEYFRFALSHEKILQALDRNEKVEILYHGKRKGILIPYMPHAQKSNTREHPYFGMQISTKKTVKEEMQDIRGGRYDDI